MGAHSSLACAMHSSERVARRWAQRVAPPRTSTRALCRLSADAGSARRLARPAGRARRRYGTFEGATGGRKVELDDALFAVCDVFANQMPVHYVGLMLFCLIFPVLVLNDIFLPCWQCYDFEAAAVHEIGHILGFDHPDQFPQYNFVTDRTAYNCSAPWTGVSRDSAVDANSVMQAFLARNPKTCLTRDDLDGLNFLYPVCSDTMQQEPSCEKARARARESVARAARRGARARKGR